MPSKRSSLLLAACVAAVALWAPVAVASEPPAWPDTLSGPDWSLVPATPCALDSVWLTVMGFYDTPCDSFIGVQHTDPTYIRVRSLVRDGYACFVAPVPYPIRLPLGLFGVGPQTITIQYETVHLRPDGSEVSEFRYTNIFFNVTADCPAHGPLPYVRSIVTDPPYPCAQQPTALVLQGVFKDGCGRVIDQSPPGKPLELTIKVATGPDTACTLSLVPWRVAFPLGTLAGGSYSIPIILNAIEQDPNGLGLVRKTYTSLYYFRVAYSCEPSPGPLPYVNSIQITAPGSCGTRKPCPSDSVLVRVAGLFPNNCFSFRGIQLVPSPIVGPMPEPPIVRIIVDDGACLDQICDQGPVPWSGAVTLPPLPARDYQLPVELAHVSCSNTYPPGELFRGVPVPFTVVDSCPAPVRCLVARFAPGVPGGSACNATLAPGAPAQLTFQVGSSVALAGLQGELKLHPTGLRITNLEAIGPATGMLVSWTATPEGVQFLLLAEHGAPIPPLPPHNAMPPESGPWPVLRITVEEPASGEPPERTYVTAENLLGSDIDGHGIPLCTPPPCVPPGVDPWFGPPSAVICAQHGCDFNADGLEDIRDLVLMVRCIAGDGSCPPDGGLAFDCDGDQAFGLGDVLCCARHILAQPPCPECVVDSSRVRPEPGVTVSFGTPVTTSEGVDVPVHIAGSERLGAAMLTLELPLDRYDVAGFDGEVASTWLTLHDVEGGHLLLGMIEAHLGPALLPHSLDLTVHLKLKSGQLPGGEVAAVSGEFSGPDGWTLAVPLGRPSQMLPGSAHVELSGNRPNPFSVETRFTLQLARAADVEVGIFDLRGRRVATVFRGHLATGPQEFAWNGRGDDGTLATNGVYFYRVVAGGRTVARKLILMRVD